MLERHRKIAASPQRTSAECWQTIADLIRDSLERSPHITAGEIEASLGVTTGIGRQLVAGGHLDRERNSVTVIAADLHLSLSTVSGDRALSLEENLNFVPGAARAEDWTIYLPTPDPLGPTIEKLAATDAHLSDEKPPDSGSEGKSAAAVIDAAALRKWAEGRS
jgi:hypothetical protein